MDVIEITKQFHVHTEMCVPCTHTTHIGTHVVCTVVVIAVAAAADEATRH